MSKIIKENSGKTLVCRLNDKRVDKAILGSFAGIVVASLAVVVCCLGPALFVAFGLTLPFLTKFSFLALYKPYFFIVAFILIGYSFFRSYRKCECSPKAIKINRGLSWTGLTILILAVIFNIF